MKKYVSCFIVFALASSWLCAVEYPEDNLSGAALRVTGDGQIQGLGVGGDYTPPTSYIIGSAAYPLATVNTAGGALVLSGGMGRRLYTVIDKDVTAGDTYEFTVNGAVPPTTLTAGVDFVCAGAASGTACATNMAASINSLVSGVAASASGTSVYLYRDATTYSLAITSSDAAGISATSGADGAVSLGSGVLTFPAGTEGAPGLAVTGDLDTGIYSPGANQIGLTAGGSGVTWDGSTLTAESNIDLGAAGSAGTIEFLATGATGGLIKSNTANVGVGDVGLRFTVVGDLAGNDYAYLFEDNNGTDLAYILGTGGLSALSYYVGPTLLVDPSLNVTPASLNISTDGTAAAPSLTWSSSGSASGLFLGVNAQDVGISIGTSERGRFTASGLSLTTTAGTSLLLGSTGLVNWNAGSVSLSEVSPGVLGVGTGADGEVDGQISTGKAAIGGAGPNAVNMLTLNTPTTVDATDEAIFAATAVDRRALSLQAKFGQTAALFELRPFNSGIAGISMFAGQGTTNVQTRLTDVSEGSNTLAHDFQITLNPAGTRSGQATNLYTKLATNTGNAQNFTDRLSSYFTETQHNGTGTVTSLDGSTLFLSNTAGGTVTNMIGVNARVKQTGAGTTGDMRAFNAYMEQTAGTATAAYGLYIDDWVGTFGSKYGVYQVGTGGLNFFGSPIRLGSTGTSIAEISSGVLGVGTGAAGEVDGELDAGDLVIAGASLVSDPAASFTGAWYSGGTGTTTMPHVLIQPTGATAGTAYSTSGTGLGINADVAAGDLIWAGVDGTRMFSVGSGGTVTAITVSSPTITSGGTVTVGAGGTTSVILGTDGSRNYTGAIELLSFLPSTSGDGGVNSSGDKYGVNIKPTWNFTGATRTGDIYDLRVNPTETSLTTGTHYLVWAGTAAGGRKFSVDNQGLVYQRGSTMRTATQTVTDSAALTADDTLVSPTLAAGSKWKFKLQYFMTTVATSGVQVDLAGGSGTFTSYHAFGTIDDLTTVTKSNMTASTTTISVVTTTGTFAVVTVEGSFQINAAGTFIPRFSQGQETGAAESVIAGINSSLTLTQIQ